MYMRPLFEILPTQITAKNSPSSERASIIKEFVDRINLGRPCTYEVNGKKKTLQKLSPRAIAVRVGYLKKNSDLYFLLSLCKQSTNFSKTFFFHTKSQKVLDQG